MTTDIPRRRWFDRRFGLGLPPEAFPDIIERLRGTPARLEDRTRGLSDGRLVARVGDAWSIQEHVGHLLDLEPLWSGRLEDLLGGAATLRPADLTNRATHEANHNASSMAQLLRSFRTTRSDVVGRLEYLGVVELTRTARHPRLQQPMTITDLYFFVAEHDDHHLAAITALLRAGDKAPPT